MSFPEPEPRIIAVPPEAVASLSTVIVERISRMQIEAQSSESGE